MILENACRVAAVSLAVCSGVPAQADVLEITQGSAQWVAGGPEAGEPASAAFGADDRAMPDGEAQFSATQELPVGIAVPDAAIANPARTSSTIPDTYEAKVHELSRRFDLSPALIEALVWQESRWRPNARSHAGARGLAQLMPATARDLGVDPDDPFANLEGGSRYLREQLDRFDGNLEKALAAYNAGPGRVEKAGGIPPIRETQNYVAAIIGRLSDHSRR